MPCLRRMHRCTLPSPSCHCDGAAGLQRASELFNGMHAEGERDPRLLAKLILRTGFALLALDLDELMESAVHSAPYH